MPDRCELCGAKLRDDDRSCRECGASLDGAPAETDAAREITAVESPPAVDGPLPAETNPELTLEAVPKRRGPVIALAVIGALAAAGVFAYVRGGDETQPTEEDASADPDAPADPAAPLPQTPGCDALAPLEGHWTFTTEVTGARVVQSSGLNGFYALDVEVDGCAAKARLTKTGYTARSFTEARVQHAEAALEVDERGFATAAFDLESSLGPHGTTEFSFIAKDDRLSGVYRQRGDRWEDGGLFGFLRGLRDEEPKRELVAAEEPCLTRCHLACGGAVRDVPEAALSACTDACEEDAQAPARCGDAQDLPEAYALPLQGPARLSALCKRIGGCTKKKLRGPSLGADRLPQGWSEVKMVRGRKEGGVRMALHGPGGWYLSAPLFEAAVGTRLGKVRLYARQLSEPGRRFVLGLARLDPTAESDEAYVACRLDEPPSCARVIRPRSSLVNALPEGNLSVADGAGEVAGVFWW